MSNPESQDRIYLSLLEDIAAAELVENEKRKKLEEIKSEYESLRPQTGEIAHYWKRYFTNKTDLEKATQKVKYTKMRAFKRKKQVQIDYLTKFPNVKDWNPSEHLEEFETHKRLINAPKKWPTKFWKNSIVASQKETSK